MGAKRCCSSSATGEIFIHVSHFDTIKIVIKFRFESFAPIRLSAHYCLVRRTSRDYYGRYRQTAMTTYLIKAIVIFSAR